MMDHRWRWLYAAVRDQIRERGAGSVSPEINQVMRYIATNDDASLRIEAIYDGGEMIIIEVGSRTLEALLYSTIRHRRTVVLQSEAVEKLRELERARCLAGWFGNVPAVVVE